MTFLILPKVQNSNLQSFDIEPNSSCQGVSAHFQITERSVCQRNILNSLRKVSWSSCQMANYDLSSWQKYILTCTYLYVLNQGNCKKNVLKKNFDYVPDFSMIQEIIYFFSIIKEGAYSSRNELFRTVSYQFGS